MFEFPLYNDKLSTTGGTLLNTGHSNTELRIGAENSSGVNSRGHLYIRGSNGYYTDIYNSTGVGTLTADRTLYTPDKSGTIAITSDVASKGNLGAGDYGNSFDNVKTSGLYYCNNFGGLYCMLLVIADTSGADVKQIRMLNNTSKIEQRFYWNGSWSSWSTIVS